MKFLHNVQKNLTNIVIPDGPASWRRNSGISRLDEKFVNFALSQEMPVPRALPSVASAGMTLFGSGSLNLVPDKLNSALFWQELF